MNSMRSLSSSERALLTAETAGEILRWTGKPHPGRAFRSALGIYAMAIPWCALCFSLFGVLIAAIFFGKPPTRAVPMWEYGLMGGMVLFMSGFVAAGIAMLSMPFWARSAARRTVYAITDRRVVTIVDGRSRTVTSVEPASIRRTSYSERRDGSGTLRMVTGFERDSDGDTMETAVELAHVPGVKAAERAVEQLRKAAASSATVRHEPAGPEKRSGAA